MFLRAPIVFLLIPLLLTSITISAQAKHYPPRAEDVFARLSKKIKRFRVVAPGIVRGGQPSDEELALLRAAGVKTIVNLRDVEDKVAQENSEARVLGLRFVNIPLSPHRAIPPAAVREFLSVVTDPKMQPVFVHCKAGKDRTGAMIAIFRVAMQGWSAARAYAEMLAMGFDDGYERLAASVRAYTAQVARQPVAPLALD